MVQVSAQQTEQEAQSSYRVMQTKYPTVLGNRQPVIQRADLGDKGVFFRAQVGPFGNRDLANQFCESLKTAGGKCLVRAN